MRGIHYDMGADSGGMSVANVARLVLALVGSSDMNYAREGTNCLYNNVFSQLQTATKNGETTAPETKEGS